MKQFLSASSRDAVKKEWLAKWKEKLGHPTTTPRQIMQTYVEGLDITVATLEDEVDWDCWNGDFDPIPDIPDV
jgi:hypothetical protein